MPFLQAEGDHGRIWIFTDVTEAWQARRDPLTGVANRRAYARRFPDFALRPDDGLLKSLAIIDVDNFKGYNDRYGHAAGDAVLIRVADVLSGLLSGEDDELFRIGGEEFVIIGKHRTAAGAGALFERLRAAIERQGIEHAGNPGGVVTASFGVVLFRGAMHPGHLFDHADQCLYRAKEAGRNRVTIERLRRHAAETISPAT
ncbi:GGDEF domain-containing protein [Stella sp.]|uniref:GGDEF domain-containing protein n=1 Tax=Stella sp. TaxID=2912054 RepID=UPI0035B06141